MGFIVALTQGGFTAITDSKKWKDLHPGILSLIGAGVATLGAILYSVIFGEIGYIFDVTLVSLVSLLIIGVLSNGLGFSLFLIANQKTSGNEKDKLRQKVWWLSSLALVPFVQMLFLLIPIASIQDKVNIPSTSWKALAFLVVAFLILRFSDWYENRKNSI